MFLGHSNPMLCVSVNSVLPDLDKLLNCGKTSLKLKFFRIFKNYFVLFGFADNLSLTLLHCQKILFLQII